MRIIPNESRSGGDGRRTPTDGGQATAEYALVILGAAALALLVIAWAANTSAVGDLMDAVLESVRGRVG
ncbi:MAG: DUF4244 domain-containing protein [Actinomycetota bacterium]